MSNHTPGPWKAHIETGRWKIRPSGLDVKQHTAGYAPIALVDGDKRIEIETRMANAHLIASAPELLAIVKTLLAAVDAVESGEITGAYLSKDAPLILHARAVIAKATGSIGSANIQESPT